MLHEDSVTATPDRGSLWDSFDVESGRREDWLNKTDAYLRR
jgi:hypothetical protein